MKAKDLVELNNQKRKELTEENLKYYEDMLVYIRLSYDKSEQETEEVLSELLDHLLEAQKEGRTANDVFGEEPKRYADEIIGELPKMVTKQRFKFFVMIILYFLAAYTIFEAVFSVISHYLLDVDSLTKEIFVGSFTIKTIFSVPIAFLFFYLLIRYIRWTCFKNINKVKQFFLLWLFGVFMFAIFLGLILITPEFGPTLEIPFYISILLGIILYFAARLTSKRI